MRAESTAAPAHGSISAILITLNAEAHLRACLDSIAWVDEIIVVDGGSRDGTVDICREYTDRIFIETEWAGFGVQKNRALGHARCDWVLAIDADERLSPALSAELRHALRVHPQAAFELPRRSRFLGRTMHHSGWWPDPVLRVFRRGQASFSADLVHERVLTQQPVVRLRQPLLHEGPGEPEAMLHKMNHYSTLWAQEHAGRRVSLPGCVLRGIWAFLRTYLLQRGFLDGPEGFALAVANAEGTYYKYLKCYFARRRQPR